MQIVTIHSPQNEVLYQVAKEVDFPLTEDTMAEIAAMHEFYIHSPGKSGFAAPQVGLSKRIILIEQDLYDGTDSNEPVVLINPTWTPLSEEKAIDFEGCLSVPSQRGFVERYTHVRLTAWKYDRHTGDCIRIEREYLNEFSCALWQHEIDHLEGVIYVDIAKLVLSETDLAPIQEHLIQTGQWRQDTPFFEFSALMYPLALELQQSLSHGT